MILAVGGIKGGSGKTTVSTNLCVMRALAGKAVLLIDADDQETATDFTTERDSRTNGETGYTCVRLSGANLRTQVKRMAANYQDIIIDVGGRDTTSQRAALSVAQVFLVPFVPRSFDIWTLGSVAELVAEMREVNPALVAYVFINRADSRGEDNRDTAEILKAGGGDVLQFIEPMLISRKVFGNAAAKGMAVCELTDAKATEEITALYQYIFKD